MKKLDKLILTIFSIIILVGGIIACLIIAGILDIKTDKLIKHLNNDIVVYINEIFIIYIKK